MKEIAVDVDGERIVSDLIGELENAWNAADGARFARPFTEDADFVNIRGDHFRTREVIANGHQAIFDTIYKGSVVRYRVSGVRTIASRVLLAHVKSTLKSAHGAHRRRTQLAFYGSAGTGPQRLAHRRVPQYVGQLVLARLRLRPASMCGAAPPPKKLLRR
jgi:uncharacterized protein (TIGR02246 family)